MKNTFRIIALMAILHANSVFAASGTVDGSIGLIGWIFIGFMALIVAFQLIPSLMMFGSLIAAAFGKAEKNEEVTDN